MNQFTSPMWPNGCRAPSPRSPNKIRKNRFFAILNALWTCIKDAGIAIRHSRGRVLFFTAGSRNGLEGVDGKGVHTQKQVNLKNMTLFCYRKIIWGRQTGWKTRPASAGSDNEAHWSCKRRVAAKVVQNLPIWVENHKNQGFKMLDSGNPKFSRRRPTQPSRLVSFKQETIPQTIE